LLPKPDINQLALPTQLAANALKTTAQMIALLKYLGSFRNFNYPKTVAQKRRQLSFNPEYFLLKNSLNLNF